MYGHLYEDPFGHTTRGPLQSGWNGHVLVSRSETRLYPGTILYIQFSIRVFTNFVEHRKSIIKIVAIKREWRSIQWRLHLLKGHFCEPQTKIHEKTKGGKKNKKKSKEIVY
ncbi:uncharacterized protein LOC143188908 isoform X2 [Calliopsis andreniformis]|uniref:uncharacterized protein LOC143188908 isoform X2 n=1 Tax=Calliopsis andreniformis TaxID=337506 RepID=UPI003FCD0914